MAVTSEQGMGSQAKVQDAEMEKKDGVEAPRKRRRTGVAKRHSQEKVGRRGAVRAIDLATAALSAEAQRENARIAQANGRKARIDAAANLLALPFVLAVCLKHESAISARGTTKNVVKGAQLNADRLGVIVEVESLSARNTPSDALLAPTSFIGKLRDGIIRVLPGVANAKGRRAFGFGEQVRAEDPGTVLRAAQKLLAGKKAMPKSRAARLIIAEDEKVLKAIVAQIKSDTSERVRLRASSVDRTTERDLLNTALELFFDDYAASVGLALQGDEVARAQALKLIPRREERRDEAEGASGGGANSGAGSTAAGSAGSTSASAGSAAPAASAAAPAVA